jgi:hypothetical protein
VRRLCGSRGAVHEVRLTVAAGLIANAGAGRKVQPTRPDNAMTSC